ANSVFQSRPYQKNIQTGTYRIWKDLTSGGPTRWANIWPFETERSELLDAPWIFEGFPSLLWREVLGLPTRDLSRLRSAVEDAWRRELRGEELRVPDWGAILRSP